MKLPQVSTLSGRGQGILATMFQQAPILQEAEFALDASTHFVVPTKYAKTGSAARAVGDALQRDAQSPNPTARSLALYGREFSLDDVYLADANVGMAPEGLRMIFDQKLVKGAAVIAEELENGILAGTDASNEMLGLAELIKDAAAAGQTARLGFTTAELAAMNHRVELDLASQADQNSFMEQLELKMAEVPGANCIICNANLKARLATIARRIGAAGETRNTFGTPLSTVNGVTVVPVTTGSITNTESDGTNSIFTSLYIVRWDPALGAALSTNVGVKFDDIELDSVKPNQVARIQAFLNLKVQQTNAVRRLSRIKL